MKIILVGNTAWSMVRFRYTLMRKFISLGYKVYVIAPSDGYEDEIIKLGCEYNNISLDNKGRKPINDLSYFIKLKRYYSSIKPDIIIHYTIKPNIYGSIAAKFVNVKSIAVVTGLGYTFINYNLTTKFIHQLYRWAFKFPNHVIFINNDDKNEFVKQRIVKVEKIIVFPSEGINLRNYIPQEIIKSDNTFRFLLIARLLWDKGIGEYVDAAKIINSRYKNVEFGLLGMLNVENPMAINVSQINDWEKDALIKYYGSVDDVDKYIANSDCIVLPSYREGKGMTLIEGACMEKPLIASNVPGCKDVVKDGVNGFLCKVKNSNDLAEKMIKMLLLNNTKRLAMGRKGRDMVIKQYDEEIIIRKYIKIIDSISIHK